MMRRGFSLIELLVVIGIIALLAGLLLPSLAAARRTAANTVGTANLKSMVGVQLLWVGDHRGEFYNPFARQAKEHATNFGFGWQSDGRYNTEGFAAYWYSFMNKSEEAGTLPLEAFASPADGDTVRTMRNKAASNEALVPGSFYYSPTMWKHPRQYDFVRMDPPCEYGPQYRCCCNCTLPLVCADIAANTIDGVSHPAAKVILWERADFTQRSRPSLEGNISTSRPLPPAWNNPKAFIQVATVDGSVSKADINDLTQRAADSLRNDKALTFLPVDLFEVRDEMPLGPASLDHLGPRDGLFPMFFAATRYGIRGRDLNR